MIIPVRCFGCNNVLADKDLAYKVLVRQMLEADTTKGPGSGSEGLTADFITDALTMPAESTAPVVDPSAHHVCPELPFMDDLPALLAGPASDLKSVHGRALDRLGVHKMCCRMRLLTTVDVLEDI